MSCSELLRPPLKPTHAHVAFRTDQSPHVQPFAPVPLLKSLILNTLPLVKRYISENLNGSAIPVRSLSPRRILALEFQLQSWRFIVKKKLLLLAAAVLALSIMTPPAAMASLPICPPGAVC